MGPLVVKVGSKLFHFSFFWPRDQAIINYAKARVAAKENGEPQPSIGRGIAMALGLFCIIITSSVTQHQVCLSRYLCFGAVPDRCLASSFGGRWSQVYLPELHSSALFISAVLSWLGKREQSYLTRISSTTSLPMYDFNDLTIYDVIDLIIAGESHWSMCPVVCECFYVAACKPFSNELFLLACWWILLQMVIYKYWSSE